MKGDQNTSSCGHLQWTLLKHGLGDRSDPKIEDKKQKGEYGFVKVGGAKP